MENNQKKYIYITNHFAIHLKLTQCKSAIFNLKSHAGCKRSNKICSLTLSSYSFGRVLGLGKYPYFLDWTYRFASRLTLPQSTNLAKHGMYIDLNVYII